MTALFDPVAWWGRVDGRRTALVEASTGHRHTYAELHQSAERWSAVLAEHGIAHGDRVAVLAQNRVEFIALLFACIRRGAMLVPLNWRLSAVELARVFANATPRLLFGESQYRELATHALAGAGLAAMRFIDFEDDVPTLLSDTDMSRANAKPERDAQDSTMLLYTSGSTGMPKGVMVTHRQLLWNAIATTTAWALGADDVGPAATPFFHTGGWNVFTTPLLFRGGTVLLTHGFEPASYLETLHHFGVTVTFGVPTQLAMLTQQHNWGRPLPSLRWFIAGGAPCPQRLKDAVRAAGYNFREGYGLTECGPNCFATNDDTAKAFEGSVGWPVPYLEMRLRGDQDELVTDDMLGELELRGPQLFGGYFGQPTQTAEAMTDDGWFRTGDLAIRNADGVYAIRGRRKEMYISGGENVFPGEVEAVLLECAGVAEASVIGVNDAHWGEVGCAIVVRSDATLNDIVLLADARTRLAGYKVPKRVCFVDAIPRLGSGKVDRRALSDMLAAAQ